MSQKQLKQAHGIYRLIDGRRAIVTGGKDNKKIIISNSKTEELCEHKLDRDRNDVTHASIA